MGTCIACAPAIILAIALACLPAQADPLDTFGFGARAAGMAGAVTASAAGASAAHANPAAVALGTHAEVSMGWGYGRMGLELDGAPAEVLDSHGSDLGLFIPFKIGRAPAGFGLAIYLPDQFIARIQLIPATEPHFVLLDNDIHRIVAEPVLSVRPRPWLALGGGVSVLADAAGNGITFDVGVEGGEKVGESALDVALPTRATPLVGILAIPHRRFRLGATYREELDLNLKLDILANVDVAGVVTGDVLISVRAMNYFTPRHLSMGAALELTDALTVTGDLSWLDWSSFSGGSPDIRILIALGISPPLVETMFPAGNFHDTWQPRTGIEWKHVLGRTELALRGGYAYSPSPVPEQTGLTSFADNDRHVFTVGGGITFSAFEPILTRPIGLDIGFGWHHLVPRLTVKDQTVFQGGALSSGGDILRAGATVSIGF